MKLPFYKLTAGGNDFILFYNLEKDEKFLKRITIKLCDRHYGIGADGALFLSKNGNDFKLKYLNSDGTLAFCGNGTRTAGLWIYKNLTSKKRFFIETVAGKLEIKVNGNKIYAQMPWYEFVKRLELENKYGFKDMNYVKAGTYHLVILVNKINNVDVYNVGRFFRYHSIFKPYGTNVDFVEIIEVKNGFLKAFIRTYEKGVENETFSCSSGITSSFYALKDRYSLNSAEFISKNGESFNIKLSDNKTYLKGPAEIVFKGIVDI